jgi:hypothetical protein
MQIINQNALVFARGLEITASLDDVKWPSFPEEMAWVNLEH